MILRIEVDAPADFKPFNPDTDDPATNRAIVREIVRRALDEDEFCLDEIGEESHAKG